MIFIIPSFPEITKPKASDNEEGIINFFQLSVRVLVSISTFSPKSSFRFNDLAEFIFPVYLGLINISPDKDLKNT